MSKHALFSASSAHLWTWCPWSPIISKLAEDKPSGTAAKRGTKLHAVAHEWYTAYASGSEDYEPPIMEGISGVRFYVEYLVKEEQAGQRPIVETYVGDPFYTYGGTPDALMLREVVDFKTGEVLVPASGNMQLEFLAYCADMHNAKLTIIQNGRVLSDVQKEGGGIFQDAITIGSTEKPKLVKGPKCQKCKGRSVCPAWTGKEDPNGF